MEIRMRDDGALISDEEFRARFPETSFPPVMGPELLDQFGADAVLASPVGPCTAAVRNGVTQDALGNWVEVWAIVAV